LGLPCEEGLGGLLRRLFFNHVPIDKQPLSICNQAKKRALRAFTTFHIALSILTQAIARFLVLWHYNNASNYAAVQKLVLPKSNMTRNDVLSILRLFHIQNEQSPEN